jgi:competence protein ComEC
VLNVAVSFISGLIAFNFFSFFPLSLTLSGISVTLFLFSKHSEERRWVFQIILIFIFGMFYGFIFHERPPEISFPDEEVFVEGIVSDVPEKSEGRVRFTLSDVEVNGKDIPGKVRLFIFQEQFGESRSSVILSPGDRVGAVSILKEPVVFRNPGVYSYDLRKDGVNAVGYIRYMRFSSSGSGWMYWLFKKRQMLGRIIDNSLSKESAGLHRAIVPGLKRGIDLKTREAFSAAGLAHLLSISGTHFGLLAFIVFGAVRRLVKCLPVLVFTKMTLYITPSQIAVITTLPVLFLYALISGASIPTVRSFIMVIIYMLALFLGRKGQWLNSLSIAAVIILFWQPGAVYELSFQLSFVAVLSIGYVLEARGKRQEAAGNGLEEESKTTENPEKLRIGTGRQQKLIKKIYEKVKTGMLMTVAAVMGTAPVAALVFKQFPLVAPVTNLLVTPLVCFVILPLGFFAGFSALLLNLPSMPLNEITEAVTELVLWLVTLFSSLPYASFHVHAPTALMTVCYYISLFLIFKRGVRSRSKWELLPLAVVIIWYLSGPYLNGNSFKVTFLDVGQGEAAQIDLPDNKTMLIDGGAERPDIGRMVVAPFLWSKGIKRIDYIV